MIISERDIRLMVNECIKALCEQGEEDELKDTVDSTMTNIKEFIADFGLNAKLLRSNTNMDWIGQYRSHSVKTGVMKFSINIEAIRRWSEDLKDMLDDTDWDNSEEEARYQVMVSLWHEAGHGLVEHVKYCRKRSNALKDGKFTGQALKDTRWFFGYDEEDLVEEFGEYMVGIKNDSDLFNYLMKYKNILQFDKTLNEVGNTAMGQYLLGKLARKREEQGLMAKRNGDEDAGHNYFVRYLNAHMKAAKERDAKYQDGDSMKNWYRTHYNSGYDEIPKL